MTRLTESTRAQMLVILARDTPPGEAIDWAAKVAANAPPAAVPKRSLWQVVRVIWRAWGKPSLRNLLLYLAEQLEPSDE